MGRVPLHLHIAVTAHSLVLCPLSKSNAIGMQPHQTHLCGAFSLVRNPVRKGGERGVSHTAINKKTKRYGWEEVLQQKIQTAAQNKVSESWFPARFPRKPNCLMPRYAAAGYLDDCNFLATSGNTTRLPRSPDCAACSFIRNVERAIPGRLALDHQQKQSVLRRAAMT